MQETISLVKTETTKLFNEFINSEKAGGVVLLVVTVISLVIANSGVGTSYLDLWNYNLGGHTLVQWINDGLMSVFFLLIGLELEREFYKGELSDLKNAVLPVFGAVGGMIVPAILFLLFNYGKETVAGIGIPMATDIAFAIGILSLLGNRVPVSLKIFLTALAIFDDLGAIIIIAVFYTSTLFYDYLFLTLGIFLIMVVMNRFGIKNLIPYLVLGTIMWYFMLNSGVHASVAGVMLAFVVPFGDGGERSPSYVLQHILHMPVAFIIIPLFALANTSIILEGEWYNNFGSSLSLGILAGLVIGKPLGILLFSMTAVKLRFASLPSELSWNNIAGAGMLGGIGFTMSIFIALIGFDSIDLVNISRLSILAASIISAVTGYFWLRLSLKPVG